MAFNARWIAAAALAGLCACGGGPDDGSLTDLTGPWLLTPALGGIEMDPVHLTLEQDGTALRATATCDATWPVGTGSWNPLWGPFSLAFDFGAGNAVSLTGGTAGPTRLAGTLTMPDGPGTWRLDRTHVLLDCARACDPVVVTPFIDTDFTELPKIQEISLFRSSAGHDYSDGCESCRSMKNYFAPFVVHRVNGDVAVRSPVAGQIVSVTAEHHGASVGSENKQVRIRSTLHPEVTVILFHIDLVGGIAAGDAVTAGQSLGTARLVYPDLGETGQAFDIAVRVHTLYGDRYVSWFDVVTDALFASYVARGATARSDFVISKAARDADPLGCAGETFTSVGVLPAQFVLGPP